MIGKLRTFFFWTYLPVLTVLSLMPLSLSTGVERGDLYLHALAYILMALLAPWKFDRPGVVRFMVFAFGYGVCIELAQHLLTMLNRHGDWTDIAANLTGIVLGTALRVCLDKLLERFSRGF